MRGTPGPPSATKKGGIVDVLMYRGVVDVDVDVEGRVPRSERHPSERKQAGQGERKGKMRLRDTQNKKNETRENRRWETRYIEEEK